MNGDKYTTLFDIELTKCLDTPPNCKSTKPISTIADYCHQAPKMIGLNFIDPSSCLCKLNTG